MRLRCALYLPLYARAACRSCRDRQFLLLVQKEPKHAKEGLPLFRISPFQFRRQGSASLTRRTPLPPPYFSFKKEKLSKRKILFGSAPFPQCPALNNPQRNPPKPPRAKALQRNRHNRQQSPCALGERSDAVPTRHHFPLLPRNTGFLRHECLKRVFEGRCPHLDIVDTSEPLTITKDGWATVKGGRGGFPRAFFGYFCTYKSNCLSRHERQAHARSAVNPKRTAAQKQPPHRGISDNPTHTV